MKREGAGYDSGKVSWANLGQSKWHYEEMLTLIVHGEARKALI